MNTWCFFLSLAIYMTDQISTCASTVMYVCMYVCMYVGPSNWIMVSMKFIVQSIKVTWLTLVQPSSMHPLSGGSPRSQGEIPVSMCSREWNMPTFAKYSGALNW